MAQEKMVEAGAFVDLNGGEGNAYGDVGAAGRVVLLVAKASPSGAAGYYYYPIAEARIEDLPEDLRRQLVGVADGRAGHGGLVAVALAPLSGRNEHPAVRYLLVHAGHRHTVVPEDLRSPLAGEVIPPIHGNTGQVAVGYGARRGIVDYSEFSVTRCEEDDEKVVYQLDLYASSVTQAPENVGGGLAELRNVFPAWVDVSGVLRLDAAAFAHGPGAPLADKAQFGKNGAAGLGLGALDPSSLVFVRDDSETLVEKLLGNNYADEHGTPYPDGGHPSPYAVQVLVDPAVGAEAAGAGAGRECTRRGSGNLSAVLGVFASSSAVTVVATGTVNPIVAFGFFLVLLGGVVAAMIGVRGP